MSAGGGVGHELEKGATQTTSESNEWNKVFCLSVTWFFVFEKWVWQSKNECDKVTLSHSFSLCHTHYTLSHSFLLCHTHFTFSHRFFTLSNCWKSGFQKQRKLDFEATVATKQPWRSDLTSDLKSRAQTTDFTMVDLIMLWPQFMRFRTAKFSVHTYLMGAPFACLPPSSMR